MQANQMGLNDDFIVEGDNVDNFIHTADGNDTVNGGNGDDIIKTYGGHDKIFGEAGNDYIDVGVGSEEGGTQYAWGGHGDDTYVVHNGIGRANMAREQMQWSSGNDTFVFADSNLADWNIEWIGGDEDRAIFTREGTSDRVQIDGLSYIENWKFDGGRHFHSISILDDGRVELIGTASGDKIIGSDYDDVIYGGAGNDVLYGHNGVDVLHGGAGNDTLHLGGSVDDDGVQFALGQGGDDTYIVHQNIGHAAIGYEAAGGGNDTVKFSNFNLSDFLIYDDPDANHPDALIFESKLDSSDKIHVRGMDNIESYIFADGTEYTAEDMFAFI